MATDLNQKESSITTRIVGHDEVYAADVILEDGIRKLATTKKVNIESLSAASPNASNYLVFEEVADGDTLTITIQATDTSPLYTTTKTVSVGENRFEFTDRIILEMNQDFTNFQPYFKVSKVKDNSILFFEAKNNAEAGENLAQEAFTTSATGTLALTLVRAFDNWERRSAVIQASKSATDPRLGIFGISGTVENRDASVNGLLVVQPYRNNDMLQIEMNINPTGDQVFTFPMDALDDYFITEIRFFALDSNISFGKFLGRNASLSAGIKVEIKTDNSIVTLPLIKNTEDFADKFAFGGGDNFSLYIQSGADKVLASFLTPSFPLRREGTFGIGNDDYIRITIQDADNLSQIAQLQAAIVGTRREA
jgi:hypothetical protein